MIQEHNCSWN